MENKIEELTKKARWVRRQVLEMIVKADKGHIGGAFSCVDILVALYYGDIMRLNNKNPHCPNRDRFILSKGHSSAALYPILADLGFFPVAELNSYGQDGSKLGGHPDRNIPGIEVDTGSLGHGLGIGAGLALSAQKDKKDFITIALLGDGECYEGSIWEAAMFAAHHKLNNLIAVVDRNYQGVTDFTEDCNRLEPFEDRWKSFGWEAVRINGHSFEELLNAFNGLRRRPSSSPLVIIADTIKGKGVSFMERALKWHHAVPNGDDLKIAREELVLI